MKDPWSALRVAMGLSEEGALVSALWGVYTDAATKRLRVYARSVVAA